MSIPRIAPVFVLTAEGPVDEVCAKLRSLVANSLGRFKGNVAGHHMTLTVRDAERHFWSPWLHLEVSEGEDEGRAQVRGRFTPHPSVWTFFAFSYFSLIVVACFAGIWGMSQWMLDARPTALWASVVCAVLVGLLWWSAQVGQKLAREQMGALREAVGGVIEG